MLNDTAWNPEVAHSDAKVGMSNESKKASASHRSIAVCPSEGCPSEGCPFRAAIWSRRVMIGGHFAVPAPDLFHHAAAESP